MLSKRNSFSGLLKNKGLQEKQVGLDAIDIHVPGANKSHL